MANGRHLLAILGLGVLFTGAALAQTTVTSPKIIISNANTQIPLESTTPVQFDSAGDLTVACRLSNGSCPGLGGGGAVGAPTVTLTPATATTITTAQSVSLSWTSTGADTCYTYDPTGVTGWSGVVRATSGSQTVSGLAEGTYTFKVRCYNTGGFTSASSALVTVTKATTPPPPANYCDEYYATKPTEPSFTAHGFTRQDRTFSSIWGIAAGDATTDKQNVPGDFMVVTSVANYLAVEFTLTETTGPNSVFKLEWIDGGSVGTGRSGAVDVTISPCPGDFRAPVAGTPTDRYLSYSCRLGSPVSNGSLYATSNPSGTGCYVPANKKMYINMATYRGMSGSTAPGASKFTCGTYPACGVGMQIGD